MYFKTSFKQQKEKQVYFLIRKPDNFFVFNPQGVIIAQTKKLYDINEALRFLSFLRVRAVSVRIRRRAFPFLV